MHNITFFTTNIAPYRLAWFEELSKHFNITVYYTKDKEKDREEGFLKHNSNKCKVIKLNNPKDLDNKICFDIIDAIKDNKDSLLFFDGFGTLTNMLGLTYCKLHKIKPFVNIDGYALGDGMSNFMKWLKKEIVSILCPYIFCSSDNTKKHLVEECNADGNHVYVHNFSSVKDNDILDKPLFFDQKLVIRKQLGIDCNNKIVLGVGQFIARKRFEDLIIAVKKCKTKCDLYILGGKPNNNYLELVGDNKNIHFIDFVKPEDVKKYYQASDVFALTSQTDFWGLVLNEAIGQGIPVISSDNCIAGLSLVDENGVLYKTGNIDELSNAIDNCFDSNNYDKYSLRSIEIAKEYTIEGMVSRQVPVLNAYFEGKI